MLSEHVMAMHTSARNAESSVHSRIERHAFPFGTPGNVGGPLLERLTLRPGLTTIEERSTIININSHLISFGRRR